MSNRERFTLVPQRKWANKKKIIEKMSESLISSFLMSDVSESLRSLTKNEQMSESLIFLSELLIRSFLGKNRAFRSEIRWANSQPWKNLKSYFLVCFTYFFILKKWALAHSLFFGEQSERIPQVAHQKWAMWGNRSSGSPKISNHERLAQRTLAR